VLRQASRGAAGHATADGDELAQGQRDTGVDAGVLTQRSSGADGEVAVVDGNASGATGADLTVSSPSSFAVARSSSHRSTAWYTVCSA
jgi:hypothetical protein